MWWLNMWMFVPKPTDVVEPVEKRMKAPEVTIRKGTTAPYEVVIKKGGEVVWSIEALSLRIEQFERGGKDG